LLQNQRHRGSNGLFTRQFVDDANKDKEADPPNPEAETKCPKCGFSLPDFKKAGRLGCAQCYVAFREPLQGLLKTMHKGTKHVGKTPQSAAHSANTAENIGQLQSHLDLAIKAENFEQAAILRDQIRQLRLASGPA
jgi:protein arginine kinase activator